MDQSAANSPTPAQGAESMWQAAISRGQAMLALAVTLFALGTTVGGPVYHLFESRTSDESQIKQTQKDVTAVDAKVDLQAAEHRRELTRIMDALAKMQSDQSATRQSIEDVKVIVTDLNRAKWK